MSALPFLLPDKKPLSDRRRIQPRDQNVNRFPVPLNGRELRGREDLLAQHLLLHARRGVGEVGRGHVATCVWTPRDGL